MINLDRLNIKLNAILSKNVDDLIANEVHIPFLGKKYNKQKLASWLKKRTDVLEDVINGNYTDEQITTFTTNVYNNLSASDKLIADEILSGKSFQVKYSDDLQWENLFYIRLIKFMFYDPNNVWQH